MDKKTPAKKEKKVIEVDKREVKRRISELGWLRARVMFELLGNPKEHVEEVLKRYLAQLKENKEYILVLNEKIAPAEKKEGELWSTFGESELLVKDLDTMTWICINFMPASIEILEPSRFSIEAREIINWLNDVLSKLHEIAATTRQATSTNQLLLKNINALLRNSVLLSIKHGSSKDGEIGEDIGVPAKDLAPLFDAMVKERAIEKKKDGGFSLAKKK